MRVDERVYMTVYRRVHMEMLMSIDRIEYRLVYMRRYM